MTETLCACGCGQPVKPGRSFRRGHYSRTPKAKAEHRQLRKDVEPANPSGLCMCGCGRVTPIVARARPGRGYRAGDHLRYCKNHAQGQLRGPDNPHWKGGRWTHACGYVYLYVPEHPAANRDGYVFEHRIVAEQKLGRYLGPQERVHHINGIKDDNRPENLVVTQTHGQHMREHHHARLAQWCQEHPEMYEQRTAVLAARRHRDSPPEP